MYVRLEVLIFFFFPGGGRGLGGTTSFFDSLSFSLSELSAEKLAPFFLSFDLRGLTVFDFVENEASDFNEDLLDSLACEGACLQEQDIYTHTHTEKQTHRQTREKG